MDIPCGLQCISFISLSKNNFWYHERKFFTKIFFSRSVHFVLKRVCKILSFLIYGVFFPGHQCYGIKRAILCGNPFWPREGKMVAIERFIISNKFPYYPPLLRGHGRYYTIKCAKRDNNSMTNLKPNMGIKLQPPFPALAKCAVTISRLGFIDAGY